MTTPPTIEERIANLEGSFAQIANRHDRLEQDVRDLRSEMNSRFDRAEQSVQDLRSEMNSRFDRAEQNARDFRSEMISRFDRAEQEQQAYRAEVNARFDRAERRTDRLFYCIIGLIVVMLGLIVTAGVAIITNALQR